MRDESCKRKKNTRNKKYCTKMKNAIHGLINRLQVAMKSISELEECAELNMKKMMTKYGITDH